MTTVPTRFTSPPTVYVDPVDKRAMVVSDEMYETFICTDGVWSIGAFSGAELRKHFKRLEDKPQSWTMMMQALKAIGYM